MDPQCLHGAFDGFRLNGKCWVLIQSNLNHGRNLIDRKTALYLNISELTSVQAELSVGFGFKWLTSDETSNSSI